MIDDLRSRCPNIGVSFLYADYKDHTNQTLVNILGSFLRQLLTTTQVPIPIKVIKILYGIQQQGGKVEAKDNLAMLKILLNQLQRAFICIDAIDELEPKIRRQLLIALKELCTNNTRLFLTGRSHVESEVQKCFEVAPQYTVIISANQQDIQEFVKQQIQEDYDLNPEAMDSILEKDIIDAILQKSQGMCVIELRLPLRPCTDLFI